MVISFTCNNLNSGGAERVICNIANKFSEDGNIVNIICYKKLDNFYYELNKNVNIIEIDKKIKNRSSWIQRKLAGLLNLFKLKNAIRGSDIVISFYSRQNCYSIFVAKLLNIPIICAERDHFFLNDGKFNNFLRRVFYPYSNGFIHQTEDARKYLRSKCGIKCNDIIIPNPLWISDFPERRPVSGYVCAVGRLAQQKNYEGMIEAFRIVHERNPNASLHIFGDGPEKENLINRVKENSLEGTVFFEGLSKDIINIYAKSEVFIMFSHGEGYPNALMEALSMGVPSISSNCPIGGPSDMIDHGINGYLVENGDVFDLAEKIMFLLNSKDVRKKFSINAKEIRKTNEFKKVYSLWYEYINEVKNEYEKNNK